MRNEPEAKVRDFVAYPERSIEMRQAERKRGESYTQGERIHAIFIGAGGDIIGLVCGRVRKLRERGGTDPYGEPTCRQCRARYKYLKPFWRVGKPLDAAESPVRPESDVLGS